MIGGEVFAMVKSGGPGREVRLMGLRSAKKLRDRKGQNWRKRSKHGDDRQRFGPTSAEAFEKQLGSNARQQNAEKQTDKRQQRVSQALYPAPWCLCNLNIAHCEEDEIPCAQNQ